MQLSTQEKLAALANVIANLEIATHKHEYAQKENHNDVEKIRRLMIAARDLNGESKSCEEHIDEVLDICNRMNPPF